MEPIQNELRPDEKNWGMLAHLLTLLGYVVLFGFVLAEQIGLPIPAVPVLLGVGALAGTGRMSLALALGAALAASLPPDLVWYELGRRRGGRILGLLCRVSLEPDSCVRRAENLFMRRGRKALLIAKFFPGLSTIAPPLAGVVGVGRWQFILFDSAGLVIWAGAWMSLGYVFSDALEHDLPVEVEEDFAAPAVHKTCSSNVTNRIGRSLTRTTSPQTLEAEHMPEKKAHVKNEKQYEALKEKGMSKERAAKIANSRGASSRGGEKSHSGSSRSSASQGGTTAQKKAAGRKGGKATARKHR